MYNDRLQFSEADLANFKCDACSLGKAHRAPIFNKVRERTNVSGERLHHDTCGPMPPSLSKSRSLHMCVDDATRFITCSYTVTKGEAKQFIMNNIAKVNNKFGLNTVKFIHSDNGGEFFSDDLQEHLKRKGIESTSSAPNTPEHNGVAERAIRTIVSSARVMLISAGLPAKFWAESCRFATIVANSAPTKANDNVSAYELYNGSKPDVSKLRTFGCRVLVKDYQPEDKFSIRAKEGIYLGPATGGDGHRIYDPCTKRLINSRDVCFLEEHEKPKFFTSPLIEPAGKSDGEGPFEDEEGAIENAFSFTLPKRLPEPTKAAPKVPSAPSAPKVHRPDIPLEPTSEDDDESPEEALNDAHFDDRPEPDEGEAPALPDVNPALPDTVGTPLPDAVPTPPPVPHAAAPISTRTFTRKGRGEIGHPYWLNNTTLTAFPMPTQSYDLPTTLKDPKNYTEALKAPDAEEWKKAMRDEMESLHKMQTFHIKELPAGRKAVACTWVYRRKRDLQGVVVRWKARCVAKGYLQRKGIDYNDTFAPVARMSSMRTIVAIAAHEGLSLETVDIDNAYLNGIIDAEVYVTQPQGFVHPDFKDTTRYVCALNKGLYSLKQAGNIWNAAIHSYILEMGFEQTSADLCVYVLEHSGTRMMIGIHVDDFLVAATQVQIKWFVGELGKRFSCKYSPATLCLGIAIHQSPTGITLGQQHYVEALLIEFKMEDAKPEKTPLTKDAVDALIAGDNQAKPLDAAHHALYRQIVGKIMYAMVSTRPDISYSVSVLGRYSAAPNTAHLALAKRVLRYLKGTLNYKLHYHLGSGTLRLTAFVDSNWAQAQDRHSTTGLVFYAGPSPIAWTLQRQATVATSTTVAEYIALYLATTDAISHRRLLQDLGHSNDEPTTIYEDNTTAITLAENQASHKRTKHIDVKYHFIKEEVENLTIAIKYIASEDNRADFFTKQLPHSKYLLVCKQLQLFS